MKLVIGLGNPGTEYEKTNHNAGFMVIDELLAKQGLKNGKKQCNSLVYESNINGEKVIFAKPLTFMNLSGNAVVSLEKKYDVSGGDVVVIYDDIDIPCGDVRIRNSGSAGTHNGMKSVLEYSLCNDFIRFRVGTGRPGNGQMIIDFVLSKIQPHSKTFDGIALCAEAVHDYISGETFEKVRNKYSK